MGSPIFILCYSRSGSTLLRYILDTHPDICSPPEMHLGHLCYQLARAYLNTIEKSPNSKRMAAELCRKNVFGIMQAYCDRHDASIWCEKSVSTIDTIEVIKDVFPDARYVVLHRQCLDVVHSSLEALNRFQEKAPQGFGWAQYMARFPNNTIAALAAYWEDKTRRLLDFETSQPSICHRVRYEDIVQQPDDTLAGLFDFLGLDWKPELAARIFMTEHDIGPGDDKINSQNAIHPDSVGTGRNIPLDDVPEELLSHIDKLNIQLEFPLLRIEN